MKKCFIIMCIIFSGFVQSFSQQTASPEWFDWAASNGLRFAETHNYYFKIISSLRIPQKLCIFADMNGRFGTGEDLFVPTVYGDLNVSPAYGELGGFVGLIDKDMAIGFLITGSLLELNTGLAHSSIVPSSSVTNTVFFRHADIFWGGLIRIKNDINLSIGLRERQRPEIISISEDETLFNIRDDSVEIERSSKMYMYGDIYGFEINTQFGAGEFDFASLLYRFRPSRILSQLIPRIDFNNITDDLDFMLTATKALVPYRLNASLSANMRIFENNAFLPSLNWAKLDIFWVFAYNERISAALTGGFSYANSEFWQHLPGYEGSLLVSYLFGKGIFVAELGYGKDHINTLFHIPIQGDGTVIVRMGILYFF